MSRFLLLPVHSVGCLWTTHWRPVSYQQITFSSKTASKASTVYCDCTVYCGNYDVCVCVLYIYFFSFSLSSDVVLKKQCIISAVSCLLNVGSTEPQATCITSNCSGARNAAAVLHPNQTCWLKQAHPSAAVWLANSEDVGCCKSTISGNKRAWCWILPKSACQPFRAFRIRPQQTADYQLDIRREIVLNHLSSACWLCLFVSS